MPYTSLLDSSSVAAPATTTTAAAATARAAPISVSPDASCCGTSTSTSSATSPAGLQGWPQSRQTSSRSRKTQCESKRSGMQCGRIRTARARRARDGRRCSDSWRADEYRVAAAVVCGRSGHRRSGRACPRMSNSEMDERRRCHVSRGRLKKHAPQSVQDTGQVRRNTF